MKNILFWFKKIILSRLFMMVAGVLVAYLAFAYLAVDPLARWLVPKVGESQLASRLQVQRVKFDPWRLQVTVDGLRLSRMDGAPLAGFERLEVDLEASGLTRWAWYFKDIRLIGPQAILDIGPDGQLNWAELIAKLNEEKQESQQMARVLIDHLRIERGNVLYQERNRQAPFKAVLQPLGLELDGLSTLPDDRGDYSILAKLPEQGGTLKWKGDIALNPLASSGMLEVAGVKLAKLMHIVKDQSLPFQVVEGEVATRFSYRFAMVKGKTQPYPQAQIDNFGLTLEHIAASLPAAAATLQAGQMQISLPQLSFSMQDGPRLQFQDMALGVRQLALARRGDAMLNLQQGAVKGIAFDLAARQLKVAEVLLDQGALHSRRGKDGSSDWQQLAAALAMAPAQGAAPAAAADDSKASSSISFAIDRVRFEQWQLRHQDQSFVHPLDLTAGAIGFGFALNNAGGAVALQDFNGEIADIALKSSLTPQPVATLARISLQQGAVSVGDSSASLGSIVLSGLQTQVLRAAGKPLNWQAILAKPPAAKAAAAKSESAPAPAAWKASLGRLALENAAVHIEDRTAPKPVVLDIKGGLVELGRLSLDMGKALPLKARLQVRQGGALEVDGKLTPQPFKADLQVKLGNLALKPFSPYLNQVALLKLDDGHLSLRGKLGLEARQQFKGNFRGGFGVQQLAISEETGTEPFLAWKEVSSESVQLTLAPNRLHLDALRIVQPVGKFIIHEDGSMNVKRILRPSPADAQTPPAATTAEPAGEGAFPVAVERVRIDNASLDFADLTLRPQFGTHIDALSGVVNGLSTDPATTAQVELDGKVDEFGSARIRGAIQPFRATEFTDLKLSFKNLDMNRLTPYSGKFAGRRIDSGKLSVDLEYKIKQRQLAGENKFVINKLKLGERVESRDALDLPLDLAIAILEDSDGVIDLDLPITGNLDDPKFSYGKIIWKAITNVLTKIVTAPFRALGKLFGGDAEKMQNIGFGAGSSVLAPQEQEKLKMLAEAMAKRPALALTIVPAFDPAGDTAVLQEQAIRRDVLLESGQKLQAGEQPGPLDLNNTKVQSAIERLLNERTGGKRSSKMLDDVKDYFRKSKPEDLPKYTEMLAKLRLTVQVPETELAGLAKARAAVLQDYLVKSAGLDASRVAIAQAVKSGGDGQAVSLKLQLGVRQVEAASSPGQ